MTTKINIKPWIVLARPETLLLSFSGITMGGAIAYTQDCFSWGILFLTALTAMLLQILSNIANDLGDFAKGTDNDDRLGGHRPLQRGDLSVKIVKKVMIIVASLSLITGILLIHKALIDEPLSFIIFVIIGVLCVVAAIKYTIGEKNMAYSGLGDIAVFIFFGLVSVVGSYYLHSLVLEWSILLPATTVGLLSTGVLNLNNMRDIENDSRFDKMTLPVSMGLKKSKIYHSVLVIGAILCIVLYLIIRSYTLLQIAVTTPAIGLIMLHLFRTIRIKNPANFDPELQYLSLTTMLLSILMFVTAIC